MKDRHSLFETNLDTTRRTLQKARESLSTAQAQCEGWPAAEQRIRESVMPLLHHWITQIRDLWPPANWPLVRTALIRTRLRMIHLSLHYRALFLHPAVNSVRLANQMLRVELALTQLWVWRQIIISVLLVIVLSIGAVFGCYLTVLNISAIIDFVREQLTGLDLR